MIPRDVRDVARMELFAPISLAYWRLLRKGRTQAHGSLDSAYFCTERRFFVAVVSPTEQFRGVSYARDSLASWRAAQRDCYRGFVRRVLADRILRKTVARGGD
jgi:hypothetical protein